MVDSSITLIYAPFPSLETAQSVARQLIEEQLAACCNLIPGMQSIYRWEGAIEEASEVVLLVKTTAAVASAAVARIAALHPYETPAILAFSTSDAPTSFRAWVEENVSFSSTSR
jgi:periplasmic divalent cation tolerance protein